MKLLYWCSYVYLAAMIANCSNAPVDDRQAQNSDQGRVLESSQDEVTSSDSPLIDPLFNSMEGETIVGNDALGFQLAPTNTKTEDDKNTAQAVVVGYIYNNQAMKSTLTIGGGKCSPTNDFFTSKTNILKILNHPKITSITSLKFTPCSKIISEKNQLQVKLAGTNTQVTDAKMKLTSYINGVLAGTSNSSKGNEYINHTGAENSKIQVIAALTGESTKMYELVSRSYMTVLDGVDSKLYFSVKLIEDPEEEISETATVQVMDNNSKNPITNVEGIVKAYIRTDNTEKLHSQASFKEGQARFSFKRVKPANGVLEKLIFRTTLSGNVISSGAVLGGVLDGQNESHRVFAAQKESAMELSLDIDNSANTSGEQLVRIFYTNRKQNPQGSQATLNIKVELGGRYKQTVSVPGKVGDTIAVALVNGGKMSVEGVRPYSFDFSSTTKIVNIKFIAGETAGRYCFRAYRPESSGKKGVYKTYKGFDRGVTDPAECAKTWGPALGSHANAKGYCIKDKGENKYANNNGYYLFGVMLQTGSPGNVGSISSEDMKPNNSHDFCKL